MSGLFLFILILLPVIEISLFIYVGGIIGPGVTILLIVASAMLGLSTMRRQGMTTLASAQRAQAEGRAPLAEVGNGIVILLAGLLLLIPGFLTDAIGLMLLLQPIRSLIFETVLVLLVPALFAGFGMTANNMAADVTDLEDGIIEGDYTINDDD
jgi:UPF0716 protein FxsA